MCDHSETDPILELREENQRLSDDLDFERNLNNILENIRNNSLILIQNCVCLSNETTIEVIKQLNTIYTHLKTKQNISKLNQIQNQIQTKHRNEDNLRRVLRTSEKRKQIIRIDGNKAVEKKKTKAIGINTKQKSKYSLVSEKLEPKEKSPERANSSETEELSDDNHSEVFEAIARNPNITLYLNPESSGSAREVSHFKTNECLTQTMTNQLNDSLIEDDSEDFMCNTCDERFDQRLKLQNHLSKKHRIKSFECNVCPYKTFSIYHLKRHKTSHSSEKPFQCPTNGCEKWFKTKEHLYEHKILKHSNVTPFVCNICNFKTSRKASFNYHFRLHFRQDSNRPFRCAALDCNKTYTKKVFLDSHKAQTHHKSD